MNLLNWLGKKLFGDADERAAWISIALFYSCDAGFLIVPTGRHVKFHTVSIGPVVKLNCDVSEESLGEGILSSFVVTERAMRKPLINAFLKDDPKVIVKTSGIKSFPKFSKMYRYIHLSKNTNGYKIQEWLRDPKYGSYQQSEDKSDIYLPLGTTARALGLAVRNCLAVKRVTVHRCKIYI